MTVSATYMSDLSRVRVAISAMDSAADHALVERSIDGITWVTVRGGEEVALTAGAGVVDDYEFVPSVVNTYRVSAIDAALPSFKGVGTSATGNNASVAPGIPASLVEGDLMVLVAAIRNSGTGVPNTPAAWGQVALFGNVGVYTKYYAPGDTAPTVSFTGGVAGADTLGKIMAFGNTRNTPFGPATTLLNVSAQNIATPTTTLPGPVTVTVPVGWKQDDWSSVGPTPGFNHAADLVGTAGDDAGLTLDWLVFEGTQVEYLANTIPVTGGISAISRSLFLHFPPKPFTNQESTTITPTIDKVWIKNPVRPFMNTAIDVPVGILEPEREARAGVFAVVGRSLPIAVTDLRLGKEYTIGALVDSESERDRLDAILSAGDVVYLQIPPGIIRLKSMFAVIGRSTYDDEASIQWMPLTQVAAPSVSISGSTSTWATVIATYATWADLIAAKPTWADVLDIVGDPSDTITG